MVNHLLDVWKWLSQSDSAHPAAPLRKILNRSRKRSGEAIARALLVFLIIMVFGTGMIMLFDNNLRQAKHQEYMTEAYYLAYSGAELAFSALTDNTNELLDYLATNGNLPTGTTNPAIVSFGRGTASIHVSKVIDNSSNYYGWIMVKSTGTVTAYLTSKTRTLYIDPSDPKNVVWVDN
jgi:hypothetical protein